MIDFIIENYEWLLCFFMAFVSAIVTYFRTRSLGKTTKNFIKEFDMQYKTIFGQKDSVAQEFSEEVKDYVLNPATNELEELELPKNVQVAIQSYLDCALEKALQRFMVEPAEEETPQEQYENQMVDLATIGEVMEKSEYYREKLGLDSYATLADIYDAVDKNSQELKQKINQEVEKVKDETQKVSSEPSKES